MNNFSELCKVTQFPAHTQEKCAKIGNFNIYLYLCTHYGKKQETVTAP